MSNKFPWGMILRDHKIGPYLIQEYHPHLTVGSTVLRDIDPSKTYFHGIIDGKDTHESWLSLDEALVGLVTRRALGPNSTLVDAHFIAGLRAMATK